MPYQFRFEFEKEQLNAIFEEPEIAKRFNQILEEYDGMLKVNIPKIKDFVFTLLSEEKTKKFKQKCTNEYVMRKFQEGMKAQILMLALNNVFETSSLDVKQNIMELLSSTEIDKMVSDKLIDVFSALTDFRLDTELRMFGQSKITR